MSPAGVIKVLVFEDSETLHTNVSRDLDGGEGPDDGVYEVPEALVLEYEAAAAAWQAAQDAIVNAIEGQRA